jgi:hypothetical protein
LLFNDKWAVLLFNDKWAVLLLYSTQYKQ